ncbi:type II toxin-antitoxin system HipA family toxin [Pseudoxanthomonas wuyuanensis]|uniref:Serine/threonine-protein kinase HipA n=1 Tax=Pseudoxanthomonas wuyuanensis TaxID=1073196 RepID=A0A286D5J2_9GAMM|nr:type II toxin-antitoxin system HipA family toxin [Pseudoxanthomonas wuyuanensis]KAF1719245.1 type II toxin-antitoxin system HipA family toxin [Pseudoxanthomonas wuyuanensis]SOD53935.1 serine/threonine-protein kinase HipA [Pseudoxanthomonas wuyuanensis]
MKRVLDVFLGETTHQIGTLRFEAQGARQSAGFEYHADWLVDEDRFALEPGLPLVSGMQFHQQARDGSLFHGAIADTEPDGWGRKVILRDHAKQRQQARESGAAVETRALNHLDFLLAVDDSSRVGALRFRDEDGIFQRTPEPEKRTTPPLIELGLLLSASRAVEQHTETAADLAYLRGRGTSLAGLRPKCTVIDEDGRLSIGKFPSVQDDRAVTKGEVLALRLAREAGINAAEAKLVDSDGSPVALIRRFDRPDDGGRLMYISAATMLGVDTSDGSEHTYTEIVDALRQQGARPKTDIEELWRRIAFSILITNVDDHLHNHGFLHSQQGQWTLAPAFDINPFPERARELKTWISEDTGPEASIKALMSVAPYFRIDQDAAIRILGDVERATSRWRQVGHSIGMSNTELDQFVDAFEHRERDAIRNIIG